MNPDQSERVNRWIERLGDELTIEAAMNPADVEARGFESGASVTVRSRVGEVQVEIQADADIMPGVVSLPHGFGHGRKGTRMRVANADDHAGVSVNDLTDPMDVDEGCGNAVLNGVSVSVAAA